MISEYLRWLKFLAADKKAKKSSEAGTLKTKGFTLIELVVARTLLMILSTLATTSVDSLVQAFKNLQATNQTLTNNGKIWTLKFMLARAQLAYAATITDPSAATTWNTQVAQNETVDLIPVIARYFQIPSITDLPSLLQYENMHDPTGVTPDPTIQLGSFTVATPAAGLSSLPTVTWQGVTL
jgi:Tfp pilus assembly protein PilE